MSKQSNHFESSQEMRIFYRERSLELKFKFKIREFDNKYIRIRDNKFIHIIQQNDKCLFSKAKIKRGNKWNKMFEAAKMREMKCKYVKCP